MKVKETLTPEQKADLLLNGEVVGIFSGMFLPTDPFFHLAHSMCLGYYTVRSANKTLAPIYDQMLEFANENSDVGEDNYITLANTLLGSSIIRPKFIDKWLRVYDTLITKQYDALEGFEHTEHKEGNNSDTTTYDTNVEDNGNVGTKETVTRSSDTANNVYGFNSVTSVGVDEDIDNSVETTVGNFDENTSHNIQTKTGNDTKNFVIDEDVTKSGRNATGAELVEAELNLRNTQIFFDIVYKDIDSVATLEIYL